MAKLSKRTDEYKSVFGNARKSTGSPSETADWGSANHALLARLVEVVTSRGGAIRFGYTRDGGAYAVGFYYGRDATTEYLRPSEDLTTFLETWIEFYEALPQSGGRSPDQG